MAEAGRPGSGPLPLGKSVSLDPSLYARPPLDTSKTSTWEGTEPGKAVGEVCKGCSALSPTKEMNLSSPRAGAEQEQSPSHHCVVPKASIRPQSLTEMHTPSHRYGTAVSAGSAPPQAGRTGQSAPSAALPVHRSHADASPLAKQALRPYAADSKTCGLVWHGGDKGTQEAESHSMLACKQPMQLQQCNIVTTVCRGAAGGECGAQQSQSRCACSLSPKAMVRVEDHANPKCDRVLCCGSFIHHANFEDTFAAYCHPQPIPAPSQLLPRLGGVDLNCDVQRAAAPPLATDHLTLPRLISSVSETGLDGKHLLRCCSLGCSLMGPLASGPGSQSQKHYIGEECCSCHGRNATRDTGTMTTNKELRDVGVQTGESERATPHVFPQICLAEKGRSETSGSQAPNADAGQKPCGAPKSPVKEVKWDAEGMTWEVYGASVDPEELGLAIQKHLELQIKETASRAAKLSRQNTNTSRQSGNTGCQKKRSRIMSSIRNPACCARTTTAVD